MLLRVCVYEYVRGLMSVGACMQMLKCVCVCVCACVQVRE